MTKQSESVGLFINSDGPNGSGNYERVGDHNLYINGNGPPGPIKYSAEGIKHFNNWELGLSSLENTNKERFEFNTAGNYVGYSFSPKKVKVVDDIAVISYPEFTDISKVVWEHENGGLYQPRIHRNMVSYDSVQESLEYAFPFGVLPLLDLKNLKEEGVIGYFDNLLFLVEYDGTYSRLDGDAEVAYDATLDGKKEVFTYSPGSSADGKYFMYEDMTRSFPLLASKFMDRISWLAPFDSDPTLRLDETQVVEDHDKLFNYSPYYNAPDNEFHDIYTSVINPSSEAGSFCVFGFMGYRKVSIIKYSVAKKCGKVDIYHRKNGIITSVSNSSVATSSYHDLKNGDMVKITSTLTSTGVDQDFNGLKYVQVNTPDKFTLYDDSTFLKRTDVSSITYRSEIKWVLLGNIYDDTRQGWSYKDTLLSPDGRNGYTHTGSYGSEVIVGLPIEYRNVETFSDILNLDIEYDSAENTALDPYYSNLPVRNRQSRLDSLWGGPNNLISDYRFGSDIDLKKVGSSYRLVVGEMGPDTIYDGVLKINSPDVGPYGKVHDFTLSVDATKTVIITNNNTINASSGSSGITAPEEFSHLAYNWDGYAFYAPSSSLTRIDSTISQSHNSLSQEYVYIFFLQPNDYLSDDYWYGSMLYHLPERFKVGSDNNYFSDYSLFHLRTAEYTNDIDFYHFYPYVDNFGKSVSIDYVANKYILTTGSTTKTELYVSPGSTSCGPVHVFDITGSPDSLQIINSVNDISTPSGRYEVQAHKARRFASCVVAKGGYMAFGKSKPYEIQDLTKTNFVNEISSISIYKFNGSEYVFDSDVLNHNDFHESYYSVTDALKHPNYKELALQDKDTFFDGEFSTYTFPSDRFGECFDFNESLVVTNAFDNFNDVGIEHIDRALPDSLNDYLHVYEKFGDRWKFIAKIAPSIDSSKDKYSYDTFLFPNNYRSLRDLGNKTYDNSISNSKTWDIDLTNSFALADDRIVLKDPLGYAIFSRNWENSTGEYVTDANNDGVEDELIVAPIFSYFNYQEEFVANDFAKVNHTKFSKMYKYNTENSVKLNLDSTIISTSCKTPVYFMSVPASIDIRSIAFYADFNGDPTSVRMVVYKKDPRLSLTINYDYAFMINGYGDFPEVPGDLLLVNKDADGEKIYAAGAIDSPVYHLVTPGIDEPFAKLITPTEIDGNTARFDLTIGDIATYRIGGSALQDTIRVFNAGVYASHKAMELYDTEQATYDDSIDIEDTLIIGFIFADSLDVPYYTAPIAGGQIDQELIITSVQGFSNKALPDDTSLPGLNTSGKSNIRLYDCVIDKVASFSNSKPQYTLSGKTRYTNPIIGIGLSSVVTHNDQISDPQVLKGSSSKSYQLFSIDNLDCETENEQTNGVFFEFPTNNYYDSVRSLDINKVDYLSLYISSNRPSTGNVSLYTGSAGVAGTGVNLYINNVGSSGDINLYLGSLGATSDTTLYINNNATSVGDANLFLKNLLIGSSGNATLVLSNSYVENNAPLFMKTSDPVESSNNSTLYVYGGDGSFKREETTLIINGDLYGQSSALAPLTIKGPTSVSSEANAPLFINSFRDSGNSSSNMSIYIQNNSTSEAFWQKKTGNSNLFMKASFGTYGNAPLYLSRKTPEGFEESENSIGLYLKNNQASSDSTLYINSNPVSTGNLNMFMNTGVGVKTGTLNNFIRGYEDENGCDI